MHLLVLTGLGLPGRACWHGREERFRLDGERQELSTIKRDLDTLRHLNMSMYNAGAGQAGPPVSMDGLSSVPRARDAEPPLSGRASGSSASPGVGRGGGKENVASGAFPSHWLKSSSVLLGALPKDSLDSEAGAGGGGGSSVVDPAQLMSAEASPERRPRGPHDEDDEDDPQLTRLQGEMDDLLATGLYSTSDPLIQELSRVIAARKADLSSPVARSASESHSPARVDAI
jgi:hypothetical protein